MAAVVESNTVQQVQVNPPAAGDESERLEDAAAGVASWVQYWQGEVPGDAAPDDTTAPKSQLPATPAADLSPERKKAIAVIKEAQETEGVATLVNKLTSVIEDKESLVREAADRNAEVELLRGQLEIAQAQLAEARKINSRLDQPLSSHSRVSQRPQSQTEISTHSLLDRCLSSLSQQSSKSRLESSLDDIDDALNMIQQNAGNPDRAVRSLLNTTRNQVKLALGEIEAIVTHDDNLERQYEEAVKINSGLERDLDRTRREMRHLKGKLSISEYIPTAMRKEKARQRDLAKSRRKITSDVQRTRAKAEAQLSHIPLTARERSKTVNSRGDYFDSRRTGARSPWQRQTMETSSSARPKHRRSTSEPLPPPLVGCRCSVCRSVQSLGGTSVPHVKGSSMSRANQRDIQQIVLGNRITLKGGRQGIVRYIGRLHADAAGQTIFIGVHLDEPVGRHSGTLDGRRYFSCPPECGLFVTVSDILDVGGKQVALGTSLPASRARGMSRGTRSVAQSRNAADSHLQLSPRRQTKKHPPGFQAANFSDTWPPGRPKEAKKQDEVDGTPKLPPISEKQHSLTTSKIETPSRPSQSVASQHTADTSRRTAETGPSKRSASTIATTRTGATTAASELSSKQIQTEPAEEQATKKATTDGASEEEIDNISQRLSTLLDHGRREDGRIRQSQVMTSGLDYYTVEDFLRDLFLLGDYDRSGLISSEDFMNLLLSQALHLHLTPAEQSLLLSKLKHMQDGRIPYAASVPHLGLMLQEVKVETRSMPSANDWCNLYSSAANDVVFWNVRTGDVTCDPPDEINVAEITQELTEDKVDVEMAILEALLQGFQEKDLGNSGFLKPREFTNVLISNGCPLQLSPAEAEQVLVQCGADLDIDMGIPYLNNVPDIREFIAQVQSASVAAEEENEETNFGWTQAFFSSFGVYYLHKQTSIAQYHRPPHCLPRVPTDAEQ
eukprot:scpid31446/ scgid0990/ CAP-Gly domain-containing linker protein 2; Cytoplasmic linker protein 115; Cytoplasmic linker protein 2; Williams-Beuren syndrome chromosomal region 3 protein; Williams-Beuren syndrome chromosomal region 4 protein